MASPKQARQWISTRCGSDPEVVSTAELLVSELVSNAVLHARTEMVLSCKRRHESVVVEVEDHSLGTPAATEDGPRSVAPSGRGLNIVSALSSDWGVRPTRGGKAVWFELSIH